MVTLGARDRIYKSARPSRSLGSIYKRENLWHPEYGMVILVDTVGKWISILLELDHRFSIFRINWI